MYGDSGSLLNSIDMYNNGAITINGGCYVDICLAKFPRGG